MSNGRFTVRTSFLSILGLGALAVVVVATGLNLYTAAGSRIEGAERDDAAADLLAHRQALTAALTAEEAAMVAAETGGLDPSEVSPLHEQRAATAAAARRAATRLAERVDSVGRESERWLAALDKFPDLSPTDSAFHQLMAYPDAVEVACCAGYVPSDPHHANDLRDLEYAADLPGTVWDYFYTAVRGVDDKPTDIPQPVLQFFGNLGVVGRLALHVPPASEELAGSLSVLTTAGVSQDEIDALVSSDAAATLDAIVAYAQLRSDEPVPVDEAYAAADTVYRSVDALMVDAIELTRDRLSAEVATAQRDQMVVLLATPAVLLMLAGVGLVIYRLAHSREAALQRERQLVDARNQFMRTVSHELRTPAAAVSGFAEMLEADWASLSEDEIAEFLTTINRQSDHLVLIVNDLLTLSQIESGRLRLNIEDVDLQQATRDAVSMVEGRYGAEVETEVDESIAVLADSHRLVQIMRNLIENAVKYGKVGVAVRAAAAGECCEITVADLGAGIPAESADRIFEFWDRGDMDDSLVQGHGMGLPIARNLAQAMNGNLVYRSGEPTGSNFVLSLPLGSDVTDHDDEATSERVTV